MITAHITRKILTFGHASDFTRSFAAPATWKVLGKKRDLKIDKFSNGMILRGNVM